ncbi:hypothetical protein HOH51_00760 [bacterium]|jgi:Holliday junction resolvase-like predicted endonuclease|nr:hypothetical protein [bacterium]
MQDRLNTYNQGQKYEKLAIKYLVKNGYQIIKHNYQADLCQIDIIAAKKNQIYLIEVKKTTIACLVKTIKTFRYKQLKRICRQKVIFESRFKEKARKKISIILLVFAKGPQHKLELLQFNPFIYEYSRKADFDS